VSVPFTTCDVCGIVCLAAAGGLCSRHGGSVPMFEVIDETEDDVEPGTFPTNSGTDDDVLRARLRARLED